MTDIVVFDDAAAVVIAHLAAKLPLFGITAGVHHQIPNPRPAEFVRVLRTGGVRRTVISEDAQLTFEAWATTSARAQDIAQVARGIVNIDPAVGIDGAVLYGVEELSGPQDLPDPDSNQQRYTWSAIVHLRGAVVTSSGS